MIKRAAHLLQGSNAESACCAYLQANNLKLLKRNYRTRCGEIDLIMLDGSTLVFVEVRFRKNDHYGSGLASVTAAKQDKLRKTAEHYLQTHTRYKNARFDVVSMSKNNQTSTPDKQSPKAVFNDYTFDWVVNAF
jgi:putative endonuclease